jgi:hypothetical protein
MRDPDAFWGLPPGGAGVRVAPAASGPWIRARLADGPLDLAPHAGATLTLPAPAPLAGESLATAVGEDGTRHVLAAREDALTTRSALTPRPPISARLPVPYHRVPAPVRRLLRDLLTRRQSSRAGATFPGWPVEPSVEGLRLLWLRCRQAADGALLPAGHWPDGRRWVLCLTHDVDTADGLARAPSLAEDEAARGLAACSYVVGDSFPLDDGALVALRDAGGELGLHDAQHDNRIAFLPGDEIGARLDRCRDLVERWDMRGFRSPSMLRTDALYGGLAGRFAYDSSMPDTGLLPAPNGCATVFPLRRRGVPILPLTLPPDGQLLGRGLEPAEVVAAWVAKAEWVRSVGGVAVHLTHPEHGFTAAAPMREAYRRFLDWAAEQRDAWHALPAQVMAHWEARGG